MERVWLLLFRGYTYRLAKNNLQASPKIACKTANVMVRSNYNKQWNIDFHMCYLANDTLICFIYALYPPYNHFTDSITLHVQKNYLPQVLQQVGLGFFLFLFHMVTKWQNSFNHNWGNKLLSTLAGCLHHLKLISWSLDSRCLLVKH